MLQSLGIYAENTSEVVIIRRTLSLIVILLLFACLVPKAQAATAESKAGAVTTSIGKLNVRASAASGASVVATLNKGSYITLISKSGSWWKVEYAKGKYGYCHADYITIVQGSPVTVNTSSSALNVRKGAGTSYAKVGSVAKGQVVICLTTSNGWSRILYDGVKTGYVSAQYLSNYYSAVSLNVPNFKQMDERWAEKTIGISGKTFSEIGCATTAIAMMESYRTGATIYPDLMEQKLNFTASGSVYWPSYYVAVTKTSGYLNAIYHKLKQGKPVLFGAVNSYGKQHWVVITGYAGGTGLISSSFTIRDPGSYSRTNLQQFLNAYPTFYKYFYY